MFLTPVLRPHSKNADGDPGVIPGNDGGDSCTPGSLTWTSVFMSHFLVWMIFGMFCLVHYFVVVSENKPMERTPPNGFQHKLTVEEQQCQAAALVSGSSDQSNMILICVPFVHFFFNIKPKAKIKSLFFKICFDDR